MKSNSIMSSLFIIIVSLAVSTCAFATDYQDAVLADNPVYYWTFDEASGNAIEQVGGDGADELAAIGGASRVAGVEGLGSAAYVTGAGGFSGFYAADLSLAAAPCNSWIVEFWLKCDSYSGFSLQYLIDVQTSVYTNTPAFIFDFDGGDGDNEVELYEKINSTGRSDGLHLEAPGQWNHVVIGMSQDDGCHGIAYINGELDLDFSAVTANSYFNFTEEFAIGGHIGYGTWSLDGKIDEVAIYAPGDGIGDAFDTAVADIADHYSLVFVDPNDPNEPVDPNIPEASLGVNIIVNSSAEANGGNSNYGASVLIEGWESVENTTIAIPLVYGVTYTGLYVTPAQVDFPVGTFGTSVFYGGPTSGGNPNPTISQVVSTANLAAVIDGGEVMFDMSGYFGGYMDQNDAATMVAEFLDAGGIVLGSSEIGNVNAADRGNVTDMLERSADGSVPVGTRAILISLVWSGATAGYQNGMADLLDFRLMEASGIIVLESGNSTQVVEGGEADSYEIRILATTTDDVQITVTPGSRVDVGGGAGEAIDVVLAAGVEPNCVITVTADDNSDFDGTEFCTISHVTLSDDPEYDNKIFAIEVKVIDNDDQMPFVPGSITMVVIPDTQLYVSNSSNNEIFKGMMQWIKDNADARNIEMVMHVGDITNDNSSSQWVRAKESMSILDGFVPYALAVGNHDGFSSTGLNTYFKVTDNPLNNAIYGGSFETGRLENSYYKWTCPNGRKFLVLALEFGPRQAVVDWANQVLSENPDYEAILTLHEFLDELSRTTTGEVQRSLPGTAGSPQAYGLTDTHCGQQLWEEMVSQHKNFSMVFNGHYMDRDGDGIGTGHRSDEGVHGNIVHQAIFNAQWISNGGDGWVRLVEFLPDGSIQEKSYSPYLNQWRTSDEYQYVHAARTGDINRNSEVDFTDMATLANNWLGIDCGFCDGADLDGDGNVDEFDLGQMAENWLTDYTE